MAAASSNRDKLRSLASLKGPFPPFDATKFPSTPHEAFSDWLDDAINEGITEPHAMTLSTVDEHGQPDARVLILKDLDSRGWHFSIRGGSPKGQQILANPNVALTFYWARLGRQVRIRGKAQQLSAQACAQDFLSRPRGSKVSALASRQSEVLHSRDDLIKGIETAQKTLESIPDFVAEDWKVFSVHPTSVEFWQGDTGRLHQRLLYTTLNDGQWQKQELWP